MPSTPADRRRAWTLAFGCSVCGAGFFVLLGGWRHGFSPNTIVVLAASGAMLGGLAAPEFEPKRFRYAALWQIFFGILGCLGFAAGIAAPAEGYALAVLCGVALGYTAPFWLKHVPSSVP